MSEQPLSTPPAPVYSPDGRFWWDGAAWQPVHLTPPPIVANARTAPPWVRQLAGGVALMAVVIGGIILFGRQSSTLPEYSATGTLHVHLDDILFGKADFADVAGDVANNTASGCTQTQVTVTLLDDNEAVVDTFTTEVPTDAGKSAHFVSKDNTYTAHGKPVTHATYSAQCVDHH